MKFASSSIVLYLSWLLITMMMATSALSQSDDTSNTTVVDTNNRPLRYGVEYYIKPAITEAGGRFTLLSVNGSCPVYVGQLNTVLGEALPVTFVPHTGVGTVVKVNIDFRVNFTTAITCARSTLWKVGEVDTKSGRRLIMTGMALSKRDYSNFFRIIGTKSRRIYNIQWCPLEVCPNCKFFNCGLVGNLRENGQILAALDGGGLPVVFERRAKSSV